MWDVCSLPMFATNTLTLTNIQKSHQTEAWFCTCFDCGIFPSFSVGGNRDLAYSAVMLPMFEPFMSVDPLVFLEIFSHSIETGNNLMAHSSMRNGKDSPQEIKKLFFESRIPWCKNFPFNHHVELYRIGEAKNPGPTQQNESVNTICVYNPSGMHNKHLFFLEHLKQGIS